MNCKLAINTTSLQSRKAIQTCFPSKKPKNRCREIIYLSKLRNIYKRKKTAAIVLTQMSKKTFLPLSIGK